MDNPFDTPISGQASWDDGLSANFQTIERGYHVTEKAGSIISSGQLVAMNSGGFMLPFNPNSSLPCLGMAFTAAASGDSFTALGWGIVRSLSINSVALPGKLMFSNASGFLSVATLGNPVGIGLSGYGLMFNPAKAGGSAGGGGGSLGALSDVNTSGLTDQSFLKWSNASSTWVPVSGVAVPNPTTWNLMDCDVTGFMVGFDGVTAIVVGNGSWTSMRANKYKNGGKLYFEGRVMKSGGTFSPTLGVADASMALTNFPGSDSHGWGIIANGNVESNVGSKQNGAAGYVAGDYIGVGVDYTGGVITFYKNGVANGTISSLDLSTRSLTPVWGATDANASMQLRTTSALLHSAPPSTYSPWDG